MHEVTEGPCLELFQVAEMTTWALEGAADHSQRQGELLAVGHSLLHSLLHILPHSGLIVRGDVPCAKGMEAKQPVGIWWVQQIHCHDAARRDSGLEQGLVAGCDDDCEVRGRQLSREQVPQFIGMPDVIQDKQGGRVLLQQAFEGNQAGIQVGVVTCTARFM